MQAILKKNTLTRCFLLNSRMSSLASILRPELDGIKIGGTWKTERIITSPQNIKIRVGNGKEEVLNFCANNYLGLSDNKEVIAAAKTALDNYGAGLSSVRFICGTQDIHKELEDKLSKFHNRQDTILYASCFDANAGIFETLLNNDDAVISDELNHASIIDGIRLCKAKRFRYKHRDMNDLEEKLKECGSSRLKLIATDGIFSMDGTVAPLSKIFQLAKKYGALTFVDDCHATGFFGNTGRYDYKKTVHPTKNFNHTFLVEHSISYKKGTKVNFAYRDGLEDMSEKPARGTEEHFDLLGKIDILNSTLGKALGGAAGGYTTGPKELIDLLRQRSRPYLFSNSLPPPVVATGIKVLDLISGSTKYLERVSSNTERFRTAMTSAGFTISGDGHPICPVMLGDAKLASEFADKMLSKGIYVIGFSYPVVPKEKARIRVQISAAHETEDIDRAVEAFVEIGKELNVIS